MVFQSNSKNEQKNTRHKSGRARRKSRKTDALGPADLFSRERKPSSPDCAADLQRVIGHVTRVGKRRTKASVSLSPANVRLVVRAIGYAGRCGLSLNRMTTIDFELAGVSDPQDARKQWLKLVYDWIRSRGHEAGYVWVMERGDKLGLHIHILLHVPPKLRKEFNKRQRSWRKLVGIPWKKGVMHSRAIGHSSMAAFASGGDRQAYLANLRAVKTYIVKAANARARRVFEIRRASQFSTVEGKRCGTSRNLGEAAVRKWDEEQGNGTLGV